MKAKYVVSMLMGVALSVATVATETGGQQPPPQSASGAPTAALVAACVSAQQQVAALATQINRRLEDARQANNPAEMRAALADLQAALVEIRTRAEQCSPLQDAAQLTDPHAGHAIPETGQKRVAPGTPVVQPGSTAPAPAAPDPHALHNLPATKAPSAPKPPSTTADPHARHAPPPKALPQPKRAAKPADPHAGHDMSKAAASTPAPTPPTTKSGTRQTVDPVCKKSVDPAATPNTTYKGVTYYFCSPEDRLRFIRNPETYLKKARQ